MGYKATASRLILAMQNKPDTPTQAVVSYKNKEFALEVYERAKFIFEDYVNLSIEANVTAQAAEFPYSLVIHGYPVSVYQCLRFVWMESNGKNSHTRAQLELEFMS